MILLDKGDRKELQRNHGNTANYKFRSILYAQNGGILWETDKDALFCQWVSTDKEFFSILNKYRIKLDFLLISNFFSI